MSFGLKSPDRSIEYTDLDGSDWVINVRNFTDDARQIEIVCDYMHFEWGDMLDGAKTAEFIRLLENRLEAGSFKYEFDNDIHILNYKMLPVQDEYNFFGVETFRFTSVCEHASQISGYENEIISCDMTFDIPTNVVGQLIDALQGEGIYTNTAPVENPQQAVLLF